VTGEECQVTNQKAADQNLRYQQNLKDRKIAVVVLMTASWPRISKQADKVAAAIEGVGSGNYIEVEV
jgi:hypothetical protein